jgi:hypothetical protein
MLISGRIHVKCEQPAPLVDSPGGTGSAAWVRPAFFALSLQHSASTYLVDLASRAFVSGKRMIFEYHAANYTPLASEGDATWSVAGARIGCRPENCRLIKSFGMTN